MSDISSSNRVMALQTLATFLHGKLLVVNPLYTCSFMPVVFSPNACFWTVIFLEPGQYEMFRCGN